MTSAQKYLNHYRSITDPILVRVLAREVRRARRIGSVPEAVVSQMGKILSGGKRVRGALMCLGYEISGGRRKEIYKASVFLELFHAGLLIHDDIMDNDAMRRSVATVHTYFARQRNSTDAHYGISMGINAGDLAFSWGLSLLFSSKFPLHYLAKAAKLFSDAFTQTVYGQIVDVSHDQQKPFDDQSRLALYRLKTAKYSGELPILTGAVLAGVTDRKLLDAFAAYGTNFGLVFQIQDDRLDGDKSENLLVHRETLYQKGKDSITKITKNSSYQRLLASFLEFAKNSNN